MTHSLFSKNDDYDFEIRCTLGCAPTGGAEVGEVLAAVHDIKPKDADGWYAAWIGLADRTATSAEKSAAAGHSESAGSAYLRAANYYGVAVNAASALKDSEQLSPTFAKHRSAWDGFVAHSPVPVQRVEIPYEDTTLPGFLFTPDDSGEPLPTVVMNNGSDGAVSAMWSQGGADALNRGWNTLFFDGPGQQSMLFERGTAFRPDWEAVLTPVFDFLDARRDVDSEKIAVWGVSQAGYWVPRAIAFEHRFAAAIVDPGVVDVAASWESNLPKSLLKDVNKGEREKFDKDMGLGFKFQHSLERTWTFRARPYGVESYYDTLIAVREQKITPEIAAQIRTPMLITSPEDEQFWPGQSEQLAELAPKQSTVVKFTAAEGANGHCQPMARALTSERAFDWLADRFAG